MEYNDYPEQMDEQVVSKLNSEYGQKDVDIASMRQVMQGLEENIKELKLNDTLIKLSRLLDQVLYWLNYIKRSDRKASAQVSQYIDSTAKQKQIIAGYVENPETLVYDKPARAGNFHKCCVEYSRCEFELIESLLLLCGMDDVCINTKCFYEFVLIRLDIYKGIFNRYTL